SLSGLSLDDVNVHYNSDKPAQLQALAYTQGTDIHVAPGEEKNLAHEAWHVVQQKQGRVAPTTQMQGIAVNDDSGLEREADVMGGRAARTKKKPVQRKTRQQSGITPAVLQAKWVKGPGPLLQWEPAENGYLWWYNQEDGTMAYTLASGPPMDSELAQSITWKPHKIWQMDALSGMDPDSGVPPKLSFPQLVEKGSIRWQELSKMGAGFLDETTQSARDWYFQEYYTTTTKTEDGSTDIASNYNARPKSYDTKRQKGEYTGRMATQSGVMALANTYALGGTGEFYYNPGSGKAERMPGSEILYQQWRKAAHEQGQGQPQLRMKEETVAGDGLPMLKAIRTGLEIPPRTDAMFEPGSPGFLAMLAVPNVTAAIFLIRDHGKELGINTITQIDLLKNSHIRIHFGWV
ncbi:MAG: DUF4157 domain-containing protein, partial [Blastocatellia bacterium]|nr:DUF4157 domain-containing protein [Blastocatellia bacterium]